MTDILPPGHSQKAGVPIARKRSLRVDLTPMVDLGFLLISFFILTTTASQPTVMKLAMPDDNNTVRPSEAPENKTLNIILGAGQQAYVYNGSRVNDIKKIGSNATALRKAILAKQDAVRNRYGTDAGITVLIKPTQKSTYADVVNALDEMIICNVKTYMLVDTNPSELKAANQ